MWRLILYKHCNVLTSSALFWKLFMKCNEWEPGKCDFWLFSLFVQLHQIIQFMLFPNVWIMLFCNFFLRDLQWHQFFLLNLSINRNNFCFKSIILAMTDWVARLTIMIKCNLLLPLPKIRQRRWYVLFHFEWSRIYHLRWPPWWTCNQPFTKKLDQSFTLVHKFQ